jgi:hypothetical protein
MTDDNDTYGQWLAQHGVAVWCPEWCQDDHGPVRLVDAQDGGVTHDYLPHQVGQTAGQYSRFDGADGSTERSVRISGTGVEFDGYLVVPYSAVGDLIELLRTLPVPEGD